LRLSILDGEKQFPVLGAAVTYDITVPAERVPLGASFLIDPKPPAGESVWTADLGATEIPVSEVRFEVPRPQEFSRTVDLEMSDDNQDWENVAQGEIYRFHQGDAMQGQLTVPSQLFNPHGRYWRVSIRNGNDSALTGAIVHLCATPQHMVFEQQPGRTYRLLYGQSEAREARYDLVRRTNAEERDAAVPGKLGPEQTNSDWSDPRPWTERYDFVLWTVLGIAVLLLGFSAVRSLRRSASTPDA
jgi:hypothetical protein